MQVLPMGEEKKPQKVAAGDLTGVTQCFSVKKGEIQLAFKTLPSSYKVHAEGESMPGGMHGAGTGSRPQLIRPGTAFVGGRSFPL